MKFKKILAGAIAAALAVTSLYVPVMAGPILINKDDMAKYVFASAADIDSQDGDSDGTIKVSQDKAESTVTVSNKWEIGNILVFDMTINAATADNGGTKSSFDGLSFKFNPGSPKTGPALTFKYNLPDENELTMGTASIIWNGSGGGPTEIDCALEIGKTYTYEMYYAASNSITLNVCDEEGNSVAYQEGLPTRTAGEAGDTFLGVTTTLNARNEGQESSVTISDMLIYSKYADIMVDGDTINITNMGDEAATVIAADYSIDGELTGVYLEEIEGNGRIYYNYCDSVTKYFLWKSLETVKPLTSCYIVENELENKQEEVSATEEQEFSVNNVDLCSLGLNVTQNTTGDKTIITANVTGKIAGEQVTILVLKPDVDTSNGIDKSEIAYIDQKAADENGEVTFTMPIGETNAGEKYTVLSGSEYAGEALTDEVTIPSNAEVIHYGDANGDGKINVRDAMEIFKYCIDADSVIVGDEDSYNYHCADVNKDAEVNTRDALYIMYYIAGRNSIVDDSWLEEKTDNGPQITAEVIQDGYKAGDEVKIKIGYKGCEKGVRAFQFRLPVDESYLEYVSDEIIVSGGMSNYVTDDNTYRFAYASGNGCEESENEMATVTFKLLKDIDTSYTTKLTNAKISYRGSDTITKYELADIPEIVIGKTNDEASAKITAEVIQPGCRAGDTVRIKLGYQVLPEYSSISGIQLSLPLDETVFDVNDIVFDKEYDGININNWNSKKQAYTLVYAGTEPISNEASFTLGTITLKLLKDLNKDYKFEDIKDIILLNNYKNEYDYGDNITADEIVINVKRAVSISANLDELKYMNPDDLDTSNLIITAEYNDGTTENVTDYIIDYYDGYVTIRYDGVSCNINTYMPDLFYKTEDGKAAISGSGHISGDFIIPETIDGYTVTKIDDGAFLGKDITSVEIPESVEFIDENAFDRDSGIIIYGKSGSYAQEYANKYGFEFKAKAVIVYSLDTAALSGLSERIPVYIKNNLGVAAYKARIYFDNKKLTPVSVENGDIIGGDITSNIQQSDIDLSSLEYISAVGSGAENTYDDGVLFYVTFKVADDVASGESIDINLVIEENDITNQDRENIEYETKSSVINVIDYIYGDADGDGEVNVKDLILVSQYLAGWKNNYNSVFMELSDVYNEGTVNAKDLVLLSRYIADWDIKLGEKVEN